VNRGQRPLGSWATLVVIGGLVILMGVTFVFFRPLVALLPEDQRFISLTPEQLNAFNPKLFVWIGLVFRSWGAFAIGLGIMLCTVAGTAYRAGERWAWWTLAVVGVLTFGIFLAVNVFLGSDFEFLLALLCGAYVWALWRGRS